MLGVYQLTNDFPASERFGITSQLRRAAVSVPTNIAEGTRRLGSQDYIRFINIAEGSLAETEYLIMLSRDLGYLSPDAAATPLTEIAEIARMLNGLRSRIEQGISAKNQNAQWSKQTLTSKEVSPGVMRLVDKRGAA